MIEHQRFSDRVPFAARVMVVRGDAAWVAEVKDLSEGGCGTFRPADCALEVADLVQLIFFDGPGRAVVVGARVARIAPASLGFEYHDPQTVPPT
ncbi:PilZ domain-containing protein [Arenimonas composti]|uniref:PilZ domain-containing protein n=1 Tax=Arenimonas composti TR7-09 = DSM 18010 TaxID=1121013 RepID=A0A091BBA8_9GAMM|nr:PilZ domain-containing protein [Arenimonas composti]KFN48996.1 hypothetical protein P873_12690 [Arenimonas composti TR7-09 = DSM 18010]